MFGPDRIRHSLYLEYCKELNQYDPKPCSPLAIRMRAGNVADTYITDPEFFSWKDIICNGKVVGFLITGKNLHLHGHGLYICEAYVSPEYRKMGLMTSAVDETVAVYSGGPIFMEIFDANEIAKTFWKNTMNKLHVSLVNIESFNGLSEYFYCKE